MLNLLAFAVPVFFLLIAAEAGYCRVAGKHYYDMFDSVCSIACGTMQTLGEIVARVLAYSLYILVYEHFRVMDLGVSVAVVLGTLVAVDFCYYWFHRLSHRVNLLWAMHAPHHYSEEFNLTTALRQGAFEPFFSELFYLPLAVAGVPPIVFIPVKQGFTIYQFWIHTRAIETLGVLERFLVTPSHHRVHHGRDEKYLDKNFSGLSILWDRWFGTFQREEETVHYGTVQPLGSLDPVGAQFHHVASLIKTMGTLPTPRDKVLLWLKPPGWLPASAAPKELVARPEVPVARTSGSRALNGYVMAQFVPAVLVASYLLSASASLRPEVVLGAVALVVGALAGMAAVMEKKRWALPFEGLRLGVLGLGAVLVPGSWGPLALVVFAGVSLAWLVAIAGQFAPAAMSVEEVS